MKIIHLSDTHILEEDKSIYGIDPSLRLVKAIESINLHHFDAQFVAVTGDLTQHGKIMEYKRLKKLLKSLKIPYFLIVGNHDNKENFKKVFKDIEFQYGFDRKNIRFIFLDTTLENEERGGFCAKRLTWLEKELKNSKSESIYLFMHHFPLTSGLGWMDKNANFTNAQNLFELITKHKAVKHIFCGHLHRNIFARFINISVSSTKSTTFQVAYNPNTNKDILTIEEKPSYAVIKIDKDGFVLNNDEYLTEDSVFHA